MIDDAIIIALIFFSNYAYKLVYIITTFLYDSFLILSTDGTIQSLSMSDN